MMDSFGFGQILLIGALICWVVYTLLARKLLAGIDSLTATTLSSILVLLLFMSALCVESADDWLTVLNLSQGGVDQFAWPRIWCHSIGLCMVF